MHYQDGKMARKSIEKHLPLSVRQILKELSKLIAFKNFQPGNRMKMLIQAKEKNFVMQAYLGDYDIHWRNGNAFFAQ